MPLFSRPLLFLLMLAALTLFNGCQELTDAPIPPTSWPAWEAPDARPLSAADRSPLPGVYRVAEADYPFGDTLVAKWSYTLEGRDTLWHFSLFGEEEACVFICQGKKKKDTVLLNGYWRKMVNTQTGRVRLHWARNGSLTGWFGDGDELPAQAIHLQYLMPLQREDSLIIIGHRGGGRNNDLLPASENSVEMLKLAARLGATGVEIDVQLSKDGVPVLYHDSKINDRLTEKAGIHGSIADYTLTELQALQLKRGGRIPTLAQALDTIVHKTPLQYVWLDCKGGNLQGIHRLQQQYMQQAKAAGRKLVIAIGVPDEEVMKRFVQLPGYRQIPSLTELDTAFAHKLSANAWAPSWTKGLQLPEVTALKKAGINSIVWTVDMHQKIEEFVREGAFAGICSNRPGVVAYYYYTNSRQQK